MAGLPKLYWIVVVRVDTLVFLLILEEMLSVFHQWEQCFLWDYGFFYIQIDSFYANFPESFYHKWVLNFVESFIEALEIVIWILCFNVLIWCITLIDLHTLKKLCIPWIYLTWSWHMILIYFQYHVCTWASQLHNCPLPSSFPIGIISSFSKTVMFLGSK